MKCLACDMEIGTVEVWPHHCPCGYHQTSETEGYHRDLSGGLWRWGDMVRVITDKLHIPHCGGCGKRQRQLNALGRVVRSRLTR